MKNYKFSIIIANYNGEKFLEDCLSSVSKTRYPKYELIVVEDASTDRSSEIIEKFRKKHKFILIKNRKNLGLVANRNKAIKKANGDILVFLDNDTQVDANWLSGLNKVFSTDKTVGAAQCLIFDFHKRKVIQQAGMKLNPYTGFGVTLGRGEKNRGQYDSFLEIISLGAAVAVKKKVAERIGGFDRKLFHYTDDLDFSWRIWLSGNRIVLAPKAIVYHYIKVHNPNYKLYFHLSKNSLRMIIKNYELSNVIKYLPFSFIFNIFGGLFVLFTRLSVSGVLGVFAGIVWNIFNLKDTLKERSKIKKYRKLEDEEIFSKIMISSNIIDFCKLYFSGAKTTIALMADRQS